MSENTSEIPGGTKPESGRHLQPEQISDINGKIIRKLNKLLVDYPDAQEILKFGEVPNFSERIPTFDETEHGGLDMTREWGNTISSQDQEKSLRVQPPSLYSILEESIHITQGISPRLDVRITPKDGRQNQFSNTTTASKEAIRIVNRLGGQLSLKKSVLNASD